MESRPAAAVSPPPVSETSGPPGVSRLRPAGPMAMLRLTRGRLRSAALRSSSSLMSWGS